MLAVFALYVPGCGLRDGDRSLRLPYETQRPAGSDASEQSRHLNSRGLRAFEKGNLLRAEELFRKALEYDVNFGPAHNNLGQVYLARHQLYLAAWEFEYAANLMPDLVEPIINQGLAYETGERLDRATEFYQIAYDQQPNNAFAISSLVRARIKQDGNPMEIAFLLGELIMSDGRQEWVEWAKELRATKYRDLCTDCGESVVSEHGEDWGTSGPSLQSQLVPPDQKPNPSLVPADTDVLPSPDPTLGWPNGENENTEVQPANPVTSGSDGNTPASFRLLGQFPIRDAMAPTPLGVPKESGKRSVLLEDVGSEVGRGSFVIRQAGFESPLVMPVETKP